jgi:hypothetical protein
MAKKSCCYKATTIMILRIVESMRTFHMDADSVQAEFIGEITNYERNLARSEGIDIKEL